MLPAPCVQLAAATKAELAKAQGELASERAAGAQLARAHAHTVAEAKRFRDAAERAAAHELPKLQARASVGVSFRVLRNVPRGRTT